MKNISINEDKLIKMFKNELKMECQIIIIFLIFIKAK